MRAFLSSIWRLDPSQRPTYEELHRAAEGDPEALQLYGGGLRWLHGDRPHPDVLLRELRKRVDGFYVSSSQTDRFD